MSDEPSLPDLSPEAVDRRLTDLGDLYDFALSLSTARVLGPIADFPLSEAPNLVGKQNVARVEEGVAEAKRAVQSES